MIQIDGYVKFILTIIAAALVGRFLNIQPDITPFLIGAAIGFSLGLIKIFTLPTGYVKFPIQGLAASTVIGIILYGSILWILVFLFHGPRAHYGP